MLLMKFTIINMQVTEGTDSRILSAYHIYSRLSITNANNILKNYRLISNMDKLIVKTLCRMGIIIVTQRIYVY
ncbi:hypothetical protein MHIR_DE00339 [Candidatus Doolittlea endobia]|uniref:Uncharacterized protein n=1 Tax=Candidatus Doolittlea endobia TaxID=1778262 RepID=A0A143WSH4_9ENTR|nr:hypothetical protein MHIR_DE00339 [Candidatus Doolittlea endobia]